MADYLNRKFGLKTASEDLSYEEEKAIIDAKREALNNELEALNKKELALKRKYKIKDSVYFDIVGKKVEDYPPKEYKRKKEEEESSSRRRFSGNHLERSRPFRTASGFKKDDYKKDDRGPRRRFDKDERSSRPFGERSRFKKDDRGSSFTTRGEIKRKDFKEGSKRAPLKKKSEKKEKTGFKEIKL